MNVSKTAVWLAALIGVLALVAASVGVFYQDGGGPFSVTTLRGQTVEIYGRGLYRYDTLFQGAGNKGTDMVTLFLALPLLAIATLLYRHGSLRGGLLLMGTLTWFLYTYASYALGTVAYNALFLVYIALFSASFYAFVLTFTSIDLQTLGSRFSARMPRRGPAIFMFVSGMVLLVVWFVEPVTALLQGTPPARLDTYTTLFTHALDLAIIMPVVFLSGVLILRRNPLGYLLTFALIVLEALLAPMIVAQTVSQIRAGVTFPLGQIVGPIGGFATVAVIAIWVLVILLRNISDPATEAAPVWEAQVPRQSA